MEQATMHRVEDLGELEALSASYKRYSFAEHSHSEFVIAVTERGCANFKYRRSFHVAGPGTVLVHHPGEAHSGGPIGDDGWTYRAIYVPEELFKKATASNRTQFFGNDVIEDEILANLLKRFHGCLNDRSSRLERESYFIHALARLNNHHGHDGYHADSRIAAPTGAPLPTSVKRAQEYLHAHMADDVSASALACVSGLSPYHLIRIFGKELGMTPHAYQLSIRIQHAKGLLRAGIPVAEVALQTGFCDQPHFTNAFKLRVGVTPAKYR